ncbi:MAG TPA: hypothetical protein VNS81_07145 [Nocardioides sp.]|nr:hypothetical protein [Nocardioides sp.]
MSGAAGGDRRVGLRHGVGLLVGLVLVGVPVLATLQVARAGVVLHHVGLAVAGPAVAAQPVAASADSLSGDPFDAVALSAADGTAPDGAAVRDRVRDGELDAAVVLDLATTTDTLVVRAGRPPELVAALRDQLDVLASGYGRRLRVVTVTGSEHATSTAVSLATTTWALVGLAVVAAISVVRGPVASSARRGALRLVALGVVGMGTGVGSALAVGAPPGSGLRIVAVATAAVVTTGALVLSAESLLGLAGLAVATTLVCGPLMPLLALEEPTLMADPWAHTYRVLPHFGWWRLAEHTMATPHGGSAGALALVAAWFAIALLTLVVARALRPASAPARMRGRRRRLVTCD